MSALAPSPTAFQPLRLSRNEARARTAIAQRGSQLPLNLGAPWRATLRPRVGESPALAAPVLEARIEWAGAALALRLPMDAATQCLEALLPGTRLTELPPALATVAVETALADLLDHLQSLGRGAPQLLSVGVEAVPQALPHHIDLLLRADDGVHALDGQLATDPLGLLLLAGLLAQRPPVDGPVGDDTPVLLRAEIGRSRLALRELAGLAPGDVVLLQVNHLGADRNLWLGVDNAGLRATLPADGQRLAITHPWTPFMSSAPTEPEPAMDPTAAASLESLPVLLTFDLGELRLSLAGLRALQPGQVIELGRPLAGAVSIRANGALVGEGELVEIDGQLGVSVSSLFGGAAQEAARG